MGDFGDDTVRWRIVRLLRELSESMNELQDDFAHTAGLHRTDLEAVSHLSEGPLPMGALARRLALTPGAVTGLVDRLERVGHVQRAASPSDRRQTIVTLNSGARRMVGEYFGALAQRLLELLDTFSDAELEAIERFLIALPSALHPGRPPEEGPA